jgi:nitroreductase
MILVSDDKIREALKEIISPKNPATDAVVSAPLLFALCGKNKVSGYYKVEETTRHGDWFMYDLGIATQNLLLKAHEIGLGTVIIGSFDHNKSEKILSIPDGYEAVALICAGYPAQSPKPPKRKEVSEFIHYDRF